MVVFGIGRLADGMFEYKAISHLPIGLSAPLISGAQVVVLLATLAYLSDWRTEHAR